MGNYRNEVENTADYLGHRIPMFNELMDVKGVPEYVDIPTHLRMMYGHTDWKDHVVRLTPEMMTQLREKKDRIDVGRKVLPRMYAGMTVAILNNETMGPVSYNEMMSDGCWLELLDLDEAIDRAAFWFTEDILEPDGDFHFFTCYFLLAFRLALMEGEMDEEKRFEKERLDETWRKTWTTVLFYVGQKVMNKAIEAEKRKVGPCFELEQKEVDRYLEDAGF